MQKLKTFKEWLKEMVGTGAIWDGTRSPDFNWWGDPASAYRKSRVKKKRKKKK